VLIARRGRQFVAQLQHDPLRRLLPHAGNSHQPLYFAAPYCREHIQRIHPTQNFHSQPWTYIAHPDQLLEQILFIPRQKPIEREHVLANVRVNPQPDFRARAGKLRKRGNWDNNVVPDAAHIEDYLVGMLLCQSSAKQRNHAVVMIMYMARRRFFVDRVRNGRAEITGENAHHLTRVLRVEAGQKYEITDNERVWLASVETARKNVVEFSVLEEIPRGPDLRTVTLYLALIKFERFEWAVEKATELGVTRIVPMEANRSDHGLYEGARKRVERWRRIARESSEQSRRLRAPEIDDPRRFAQIVDDGSTHRIWLDEQPGAPLLSVSVEPLPDDSVALLIGPEGGWIPAEREQLAGAGWRSASLGPLILRAETAVCAALAVIGQLALIDHAATIVRE